MFLFCFFFVVPCLNICSLYDLHPLVTALSGSSQLESLAPLAATHFFLLLCLIQYIANSVFTSFCFLLLLYCTNLNKCE